MQDFTLDISPLLEALDKEKDKIDRVEYLADPELELSPSLPGNFTRLELI